MYENDTNRVNQTEPHGRGHILRAVDRREITVTGVTEVLSFDEANVRLVTVCGTLDLEGEDLRVHVLNVKDGTVAVTGNLCGVLYEDTESRKSDDSRPRKRGLLHLFGG